MKSQAVHWKQPGTEIKADPGATVAFDRARWERLGATFELVDDGDGETPGLAVFEIVVDGGAVSVGILDYGAAETFLLVPGAGDGQRRKTDAVLRSLVREGLLSDADVVGVVPHEPGTSRPRPRLHLPFGLETSAPRPVETVVKDENR